MKLSLINRFLLLTMTIGLLALPQSFAKNEDQVTICHFPPGNPANAHTITVGASAVSAHVGHHAGDHLGPCVVSADSCDSCSYSQTDYATNTGCVTTCGILVR